VFVKEVIFFTLQYKVLYAKKLNTMNTVYKRQTAIIFLSTLVLLIPLIAMQFTNEVNWQLLDFWLLEFY